MSRVWLVLFLFLLPMSATADIADRFIPEVYVVTEPGTELTLDEALAIPSERWEYIGTEVPSFGYTGDIYWLQFTLPGSRDERLIHIGYPLLDHIEVYFVSAYGEREHFFTGDSLPFEQRPVHHEEFVIPVPFKELTTVLVRVESGSSMRIPVTVWNEERFYIDRNSQSMAMGVYFGLLICMIVYNLFTYVVTREPGFLNYSLYVTCTGLLVSSLSGAGYRYLWPASTWLQERAVILFGAAAIMCASLFIYHLLNVGRNSPRFGIGLKVISVIMGTLAALSLLLSYESLIRVFLAMVLFFGFYIVTMAIWLTIKKVRYAQLFIVAWTALILAVMINSLAYLGILDGQFIQRYAIMVGSALEVLILSLILTLRYSHERNERLEAQAASLQSAKEAEHAQRQLNEELESLVEERTTKLEAVMKQLKKANLKLERKSSEDGLTGLFNRRYFDEQLDREFRRAKRTEKPVTLVMIDIDYFKDLNDEHGHLVGDDVLKELANRMKSSLKRATDSVYRYGGEEFAVILGGTEAHRGKEYAQELAKIVAKTPFTTAAGDLHITISCGVASFDGNEITDAKALLYAADEALLEAKKSGRNVTIVAEPNVISDFKQASRSN